MPALDLTQDDIRAWWSRIEAARARRKVEETEWDALLAQYRPPSANSSEINSNVHFRNVEMKRAQLFFQLPDLILQPLPLVSGQLNPQTQQPVDAYGSTAAVRELLNKLLGPDHADVLQTIDEALFDALAVSGVAFTKISYQADFAPRPVEAPGPLEPGAILGLRGPAIQAQVPVPVHERWRWDHFSPKKGLIPHDFRSSRYDDAPWLGMEFALPVRDAIRQGLVPEGYTPNSTRDEKVLSAQTDQAGTDLTELVTGVEVWSYASQFRDGVVDTRAEDVMVLIDGDTDTFKARTSPFQQYGPNGAVSPNSLVGHPIHVLSLRDMADEAWVKADSAFTSPLVKQQNTWRAQSIKLRDANVPRFLFDESITQAIEKLQDADAGQGAGVEAGKLAGGMERLIAALPKLERAESDIQGEQAIRRDLDETLAVGANQAGTMNAKVASATEVATMQQNVTVRMRKERARLIAWYLRGVRKFSSLVFLFADPRNLAPIIGQDGATKVLAWKAIDGRFAFEIKPDSHLSLDAADDRKNALDYVNFTAKSPFVNQGEVQRWLATAFGLDPSKVVQTPQPGGPPPPNVSFRFAGQDFVGPAAPIVLEIAMQAGYKISQNAMQTALSMGNALQAAQLQAQAANPQHGGMADKADVLSDHQTGKTGEMDGQHPTGQRAGPGAGRMHA